VESSSVTTESSGPRKRTRRLLEATAQELLRTGAPLTVQAVASLAGVSRATAYRYFPTNEAVVLHATQPFIDGAFAVAGDHIEPSSSSSDDLSVKAAQLVRTMGEWAFDHETELRRMLQLSLSPNGVGTQPRSAYTNRGGWIATLLEALPDDIPPAARERLAAALTALFGADAVVWTTDIAGLSRSDALNVLEWMARALVEATLAHR
jgi:AcrR family transcriptional regulator